jgi:hypothetical protein
LPYKALAPNKQRKSGEKNVIAKRCNLITMHSSPSEIIKMYLVPGGEVVTVSPDFVSPCWTVSDPAIEFHKVLSA